MATIFLELDDEITSAAARLRRADDTRVALVLPAGSRLASSRINFRLLAREAAGRGQELAIVTPEAAARALAVAAGLPAYASVRDYEAALQMPAGVVAGSAQAVTAPGVAGAPVSPSGAAGEAATVPPLEPGAEAVLAGGPAEVAPRSMMTALPVVKGERRRVWPRPGRWTVVAGAAAVVLLAAAGGAAYLFLPEARITVTPRTEAVGPITLAVTANPTATKVDSAAGTVPAVLATLPVEVKETVPATGVKVDETKAMGTVTFSSENTFLAVPVPVGTQVATASGVAFVTTAAVVVPKATFSPPKRGTVNAQVQAVLAGPAGNVPAGTITLEPTDLKAALVSVNNAAPTSGGTHTETKLVSQKDYDAAVTALQAKIEEAWAAQLAATATTPKGERIYPSTAHLGEATTDPAAATVVGTQADSFELTIRATGQVTAVDQKLVERLAADRLKASLAQDFVLFEDSVVVEATQVPTADPAQVGFSATARGSGYRALDAAELQATVLGKSVSEAREALAPYGDASITLVPDWFGTIPAMGFRVHLEIAAPGGAS